MKLWNVVLTTKEIVVILKIIGAMGQGALMGIDIFSAMGILDSEVLALKEKLEKVPMQGQEIGEVP